MVVAGHSYGGAIAIHLACRVPERVRALVLLDPALGMNPAQMLEIADLTVRYPDYTDAAEARSEKVHGAWAGVDTEVLDAEMDEHLVELEGGRVGWRYSVPAVVASWGELARARRVASRGPADGAGAGDAGAAAVPVTRLPGANSPPTSATD